MKFCKFFLLYGFLILTFYNCAKVGAPTGGKVDKNPPKILKSVPENGSVNFKGNKIYITFDEFIQLNKLNENLIISPPLKNDIKATIRNKTLIIDLNNQLEDSVTYCLNFGNSIVDYRESNPLENFEFIFSTGPSIDSFSITGNVLKAYNLEPPDKNTFVVVYNDLSDTAPIKNRPLYVGRCDKEGNFKINYLKEGKYRIYALTDKNNNLKFDLQDEYFAFLDTIIEINSNTFKENNVYLHDSKYVDSSQVDSLLSTEDLLKVYTIHVNLRLYQEEQKNQFILSKSRPDSIKIVVAFNRSLLDENFDIKPINIKPINANWYLKEINTKKDSIIIWIIDSILYSQDTLKFALNYTVLDSTENFTNKEDTITFVYFGRKELKSKNIQKKDKIILSTSLLGKSVKEINEDLIIISPIPLSFVEKDLIIIKKSNDTLNNNILKDIEIDSISRRKVKVLCDFIPGEKYKLMVLPGALKTYYNDLNDTLNIQFELRKEDYYGNLVINLDKKYSDIIIQLITMKENVIFERRLDDEDKVIINYLAPGQYKLKAIIDKNKNNKWDTGNFKKKLQPEKVVFYKGNVEIRSNWDISLNWQISE